jgi:hypothetical protein
MSAPLLAGRRRHGAAVAVDEHAAVRQPRERVVEGRHARLGLVALALAHIAHEHEERLMVSAVTARPDGRVAGSRYLPPKMLHGCTGSESVVYGLWP